MILRLNVRGEGIGDIGDETRDLLRANGSAEGIKLWEQTCRYCIVACHPIKVESWMFSRCPIWHLPGVRSLE
jgi:hypothetical protein